MADHTAEQVEKIEFLRIAQMTEIGEMIPDPGFEIIGSSFGGVEDRARGRGAVLVKGCHGGS
jgi:hypothetical protein